jgi:hypothetical protein
MQPPRLSTDTFSGPDAATPRMIFLVHVRRPLSTRCSLSPHMELFTSPEASAPLFPSCGRGALVLQVSDGTSRCRYFIGTVYYLG